MGYNMKGFLTKNDLYSASGFDRNIKWILNDRLQKRTDSAKFQNYGAAKIIFFFSKPSILVVHMRINL